MAHTFNTLRLRALRCGIAAFWLGIALSFTVSLAAAKAVPGRDTAGCSRDEIGMMVSPDDLWVAFVQEEICSDGGFVTTAVNYVQVGRRGMEPTSDNDVLAIEDHGALAERPVLQWLSTQKLQITVTNKSFIGLRKNSYQGIDIVVRFDPADPTERQQILKTPGLDQK
jgi:hypothetical protein